VNTKYIELLPQGSTRQSCEKEKAVCLFIFTMIRKNNGMFIIMVIFSSFGENKNVKQHTHIGLLLDVNKSHSVSALPYGLHVVSFFIAIH
jgi:hypothetical protein